ncbi:MAG: SDR family oxidoreductase [Chlorobi bacterium]|nr:SDR family oxidoreductase [Chlorobiota bacterium]
MLRTGSGSPGVVRMAGTDELVSASENMETHAAWLKKNPGRQVVYIPELPGPEQMTGFVTSRLPAGEGMAMVKGYGLIAWALRAVDVNRILKGEKPEPVKQMSLKPFDQRVVLITGAGRGVGAGLAERFFRDGANIVIAEIDEESGKGQTDRLNRMSSGNEALFLHVDVTDASSVEEMVRQTVLRFGGIDIAVSNAGVLKAGGLEEMTPEEFDFVNDVNYHGFFLLAKYVSAVMKRQYRYNPSRFADIIQINSKSGLQGSNRNFAYAGSKFGSIGLVQSFAMELVEYGIKVNAVCPGNFFDLPLWSDPDNGLFIQYLRTGKVPGARTVEEVRKYYENLVPMKRGCRIEDLYRAVNYIIGQQYETGQALPVTGGQVMLK